MNEWVNEMKSLAEENGNDTEVARSCWIFMSRQLRIQRQQPWMRCSPSFSSWYKLKLSVPLCLFAADDFLLLFFIKQLLIKQLPHFIPPLRQCYLPNQTQPMKDLKLGRMWGEKVSLLWNCVCKDWLWPKPQEL